MKETKMNKNGYVKRLISRFRKENHAMITLCLKDEKASQVVPKLRRVLNENGISFELITVVRMDQPNQ